MEVSSFGKFGLLEIHSCKLLKYESLSQLRTKHHHPAKHHGSGLKPVKPLRSIVPMATSPILSHPPPSPPPFSSPSTKPTLSSLPTSKAALRNKALEQAMKSLEAYTLEAKAPEDHQSFYNSFISLCIANKALCAANHLRSHMSRIGYEPGLFLANQFINLYAKCGEMGTARELFDRMQDKNVVTWNALIAGYCSNEHFLDATELFCTMMEAGPSPNHLTYLSALRASTSSRDTELGEQIHAHVTKLGFLSQIELSNALISMYSKLGRLKDAEAVYEAMVERNEVSWNSIIGANARHGCGNRAVELFVEMLSEGLMPNEFTFGSLLGSKEVAMIEELHSQIIKRSLASNVYAGSALLDAYASCGKHQDACVVFDSIPERNIVTWNSVIIACFDNGWVQQGIEHFLQMGNTGVLPDEYTTSSMLKAAATQLSILIGKQLHGLAVKMGIEKDPLIGNSLISMYAKLGNISDSWQAFKSILKPDIISWNSIIQSYVQNEEFEQSLNLYIKMKQYGIHHDEFSFVSALASCASLALHGTGKGVHCNLIKAGLIPDGFVGSALIDMYSKCMATPDAMQVFDKIENKDLITWNSIISGFAQNGYLDEVLKLLSRARDENIEPDNFTFASILAVCANTTSMEHGRQMHALILKSEVSTDAAVANALITMYTRAGSIEEAGKVFNELSTKNVISWTAMIGGYVQCGYSKEAVKLFTQMEDTGIKPNDKTFIALLTACSYAGMSQEAIKYFEMMEKKYGIKPGYDHCACMVDILGRAGRLKEAEEFIQGMPYEPDALVWRMLLSSCRIHGDLDRGKRSMEKILAIEPGDSAAYVLLSNLYASLGKWDGVEEVRQLMRENGVKKDAGKSWIEVQNRVHEFVADDHCHTQIEEIHSTLRHLFKHMKAEGYVPAMELSVTC